MTQTDGLQRFFSALITREMPRLAPRIRVAVCYQQKMFEARPAYGGVLLTFGSQAMGSPHLMKIIAEARVAAEALLFEISTASAVRLDGERYEWYLWCLEQDTIPCTD